MGLHGRLPSASTFAAGCEINQSAGGCGGRQTGRLASTVKSSSLAVRPERRPVSAGARCRWLAVDATSERRARAGALGRRFRIDGYAAAGRSVASPFRRRLARSAGVLEARIAPLIEASAFGSHASINTRLDAARCCEDLITTFHAV